ncbi:MAG TPA: APC family permease [Terriglobales bacterium]|nr:APC family permease [Terriglobales bacterium]
MSTAPQPPPASDSPTLVPVRGRGSLLRVLGVGFGLAVIIGNTIGAGILRTPGEIAGELPRVWMFIGVWILGGLYALLGAYQISELGAMVPRSGGYYVFARRALGDFAGFAIGWTDWMAQCGTTAAVAIVIGEYAGELFPRWNGYTVDIAVGVTVGVALLQWRGIAWGSFVQNLTSSLKALGFIALVSGIFFLAHPTPGPPHPPELAGGLSFLVALLLALQAVIYTYDGWYGVIYFGEEVKNPGRDIPRAMIGGVLSIMGIYVLVNLALVYALPLTELSGQKLAVGTAANAVFGSHGMTIILALAILSMLSGINAYHLMASRIVYTMSRDRLFFPQVAVANKGGTPTVALFLSTVVAVAFILSGSFNLVASVLAFFFVADYAMAYTAVFILRRREPATERPYRAWGYPWTTGLALFLSLAFLAGAIAGDRKNSLYAVGVLALSYPLYLAFKFFRKSRAA